MKPLLSLLCLSLVFTIQQSLKAQEAIAVLPYSLADELAAQTLSATDTIPGYANSTQKLKLHGIVYESDGITPAKDVIISIEQADEHGNFDVREVQGERTLHQRAFVKTDTDGAYTFYTFVPGNDRRYNQLQQLFTKVEAPDTVGYEVAPLLFDTDPLLTKLCRKKINKKGDPSRILKPTLVDGLQVVQKDIVLDSNTAALN